MNYDIIEKKNVHLHENNCLFIMNLTSRRNACDIDAHHLYFVLLIQAQQEMPHRENHLFHDIYRVYSDLNRFPLI